MNIWYFDIWGAVPIEGEEKNRAFRQNMIVDYLAQNGHNVIWFTSTFNHRTKKFRFLETKVIENNKKIVMIHPKIGYKKNISLKRILNHIFLSKELKQYIKQINRPDLIISSYPAIEVANVAAEYAKKYNVPLVIDVRDLWPNLFETVFPKGAKKVGKVLLNPYYSMASKIFNEATAITGVTEEFVKFGLNYTSRQRKEDFDKAFPFGYPDFRLSDDEKKIAKQELEKKGVDFNSNIICYFGSLGKTADFSHIINVAKKLENENIQFVIGGLGDQLDDLKKQSPENILYIGWINKNDIWTIMEYARAGLVPFIKNDNFEKNLTNKMIEYLAGGLPILSNINGLLGELVRTHQCGFVYDSSEEKLFNAINELVKNNTLQKEMSNNARKVYENSYDASKVYNEFVAYIEKIYENKGALAK